jgi:hypothetical protein
MPFPEADRVVALAAANPSQNQPREPISVHDIEIWQQRQPSFERIGAFGFAPLNLAPPDGRPERFGAGRGGGHVIRWSAGFLPAQRVTKIDGTQELLGPGH